MKLDTKTMLFTDIEPALRKEMLVVAQDIVLNGKIPHPLPEWLMQWMTAFNLDNRQRLLVLSTAVPQRILLSLVLDQETHTKKVETALVASLEGRFQGYEIQEATGLPIVRCEEISDLYKLLAFGPESR